MRKTALWAASGALVLAASIGVAAEDIGWHGNADIYGATLFYGIPNSGHAPISFSCEHRSDRLTFVYEFGTTGPAGGTEVEVLLEAGDIAVPIATTATRLDMDDLFILEGETVLDDRLTDLITSRGTLLVFVEDGSEEYPLDGAREAAVDLIENCRAP